MRPSDVARLLLLSALWGGSFLFIRVAVPVLGPIMLVEARVLIAGLTLLGYAWATRQQLALREHWRQYLIIGVLNSAIPFVLISTAELHLSASLAAILNATSPLFGALIAAVWINDALTAKKLLGITLGIAGVVILTGLSRLTFSEVVLFSIGASLLASAFYGLASVYTKAKVKGAPALGMAVGSQLSASLLLVPLVPLALPSVVPSATVVLSMLLLALLSTALAYMLYFRLIVDIGPIKALTVTFLTPIFGILWGTLFLGERIAWSTLLGCGIILIGTALVTGMQLPVLRSASTLAVRGDGDGI